MYRVQSAHYNKQLSDNITATYSKTIDNKKSAIDAKAKQIAEKLEIADRTGCYANRDAYITLKDH